MFAAQEAKEMGVKNDKNSKSKKAATAKVEETAAEGEIRAGEDFSSELNLPHWSIVTFEDVAVRGLNYEEALRWMEKLDKQNISGLCIVTDEAAARISK